MYKGLNTLTVLDSADWAQEVWSLAAMGFQLQELYVSHKLMQAWSWDELAAALKWANRYSEVLQDAHWAIPAGCQAGVHCGGHDATDCAACPQGNGESWC